MKFTGDSFSKVGSCIHVHVASDNSFKVQYIRVSVKGDKIKVEEKHSFEDLEELVDKIHTKSPIILAITGKGVLNRIVSTASGETDKELLQRILPNGTLSDFILYRTNSDNGQLSVSLIKQVVWQKFYESLKGLKSHVVGSVLGPFVLTTLNPFIKDVSSEPDYLLNYDQNFINEYDPIDRGGVDPYDLSSLESKYHLALASALMYCNGKYLNNIQIKECQINQENIEQHQKFNRNLKYALMLFIIFYMVNYFSNYYIESRANELGNVVSGLNRESVQLEDQWSKVDSVFNIMTDQGMLSKYPFSYLVDKLGATLPDDLYWRSVEVFPSTVERNMGKVVRNDLILVKGDSPGSSVINLWMERLRLEKFVKSVELISYIQNKNEPGQFILKVLIKNNK